MVKKVQTFLNQMEEYSTPKGIDRLQAQVDDFKEQAGAQVTTLAMEQVDKLVDKAFEPLGVKANVALIAQPIDTAEGEEKFMDAVDQLSTLLSNLQTTLPDVIKNLKNAREQVSAASKGLNSIFSQLKVKGPPIFKQVAELYSTLWTSYFVIFGVMTVSILFYGFWASGWFGGPQAHASDEYEAPTTCMERLSCLFRCCDSCLKGCHDSNTCFWSFILLAELIVLILFVISVVLCLLSGVKAFVAAGCSQIYIIGDVSVCAGSLNTVKTFLSSFWGASDSVHFEERCNDETLLTCQLIGTKLKNSTLGVMAGSMLASVFTFQLIVESAIMHERARWRRMLDGAEKSA